MRLRVPVLLLGLLLLLPRAHASGLEGLQAQLDTSNPVAAYRSFLSETQRIEALYRAYTREPTYAHEAHLVRAMLRLGTTMFDLSDVPPATRRKHAGAAAGYLADILNRLPEYTGPPPAGDPPAHWTLPGTEIRLVRQTEGPRTGDYIFSPDTVANLHDWHRQIIHTPTLRQDAMPSWRQAQQRVTGPLLTSLSLHSLPAPLQVTLLDTPIWKVVVALGVVAFVVIVVAIAWRTTRRWSAGLATWKRYGVSLLVPALLAVLVLLAYGFLTFEVVLSGPVSDASMVLGIFVLYFAGAWAAWNAWWFLAEGIIASPIFPDDIYDANLLRLVARVGSLISAGGLIILGANDIGIPALGLLAGVSIGGVALALAAQSTVENLFGGVSIFADRPFRVGDNIQYGEATGTVITIGPRSSRIRAEDGRITTVPNADLAKMHITNLSLRDRWAFHQRVGIARETPRQAVLTLLDDLQRKLEIHGSVVQQPGWPRVRLAALTDEALEIEVDAQIIAETEDAFTRARQELILVVLEALETVHVHSPAEAAERAELRGHGLAAQ